MLTRRALFVVAAGLALPARARRRRRVLVQVWRPAPSRAEIDAAIRAIGFWYDVDIATLDLADLPRSAYYAPRNRHRADALLDALRVHAAGDDKIVGLTAGDVSTTKGDVHDWGVMGLGDVDGPACVVSTFRCKKGAKSAAHARARFGKVVVHELGHTFGSDHCPTPGCIMHDAEGKASTVDGERDFCPATRALFARKDVPLRGTPPDDGSPVE